MKQLLHMAAAALARLSRREQRLLALFGSLLVLAGAYVAVVEPVARGRERMERRIEALGRDLSAMETLAARIRLLEVGLKDTNEPRTAAGGFSLFSFMDRATTASVSRDAVASMNPSRRPARKGFEESAVELRLTSVALREMVALLEAIEEAAEPVYIKRLELKRRYDDNTRFDAVIVAATVSRT